MDWKKLRAEYIAGGTSYRKLAEKYDVSFHTLRKQAAKENWKALKDETTSKTVTKIIEIESDKQAERMKRLLTVSDKLLLAVEDAVNKFQAEELLLDRTALKSLSGTIKDIKDIQSLKTSLDIEEQKARIAILKKQAEADSVADEKPHGVVLMPPIMDDLIPPKEDDNG